jgi:8-amino-7-oxononanoate synthase
MTGSALEGRLQTGLARVREQNLYRTRRVIEGGHGARIRVDGRECVNFCSNDYLGLAADPRIAEAARATLSHCGTGSGAAALVSGYNREHRALEETLAEFTGRPRALLFSTGWAANLGVLRALLGRNDVLLADELNHASLIDGGRLSGARYERIAHADAAAFAAALEAEDPDDAALRLIVTDSVFSMDGDLAPLPQLAALAQRHRAALMIDDAHGFGVLGPRGRGAVDQLMADGAGFPEPEIYVATLGKAVGCGGAFVAGSEALIETLIQRARSWIFSTAPPPALAAAARRGVQILDREPEHRQRLFANLQRFRAGSAQLGIPLEPSQTPIQPLIVGDAAQALEMSRRLFEQGLWVAAIRPPTVPRGTSRLRITLSTAHEDADIDRLLEALAPLHVAASPRDAAVTGTPA